LRDLSRDPAHATRRDLLETMLKGLLHMRRTISWLCMAVLVLSTCGCGTPTEAILPEEPERLTLRLQSPAFVDGGSIPKVYTCDGRDVSPPLSWAGVPEAARSLALICEDPDAPMGTFTHWVLFDLPPDVTELKEGLPPEATVKVKPGGKAARQGKNDFGKLGYGGPCPPRGTHRYVFRLYALDTRIDRGRDAMRGQVLGAMKGHVLAEGRLLGKYSR